ncbi:hypothetical protein GCM10027296_27330 [Chitinimonas naiadis]
MKEMIDFSRTAVFREFLSGLGQLAYATAERVNGVFVYPRDLVMVSYGFQRDLDYALGPWWPADALEQDDGQAENLRRLEYAGESRFIAVIYTPPGTPDGYSAIGDLQRYSANQPFPVLVIERETPVLAAAAPVEVRGGQEILSTISGAVGGFLRDQHQDIWGVTCGHVAQSTTTSVQMKYPNGSFIQAASTVHTSYDPAPLPCAGICNPYVAGPLYEADVALFRLNGQHQPSNMIHGVGMITDIRDRTQLSSGDTVAMSGPFSGSHSYKIGGYGVTNKFRHNNGSDYCFTHMYDFAVSPGFLARKSARLGAIVGAYPLQGDSGSWLCAKQPASGEFALCGCLIGVIGGVGYAMFADSLLDWAKTNHGLKLGVL